MTDRLSRVGRNEALFREVNERVREVVSEQPSARSEMNILCECGTPDCTTEIPIAPSDYEDLRREATLFAVVPGHIAKDVEQVVEHHDEYDVVRKYAGPAAKIAEVTAPRRGP